MTQEMDYTRHYSWWHDDSDEHFEQMARYERQWLCDYWPQDRTTPVLDIGSGMGFILKAFLDAGFRHTEGIDADKGQIAKSLRRNLPAQHVPVSETLDWMAARKERYGFITAIDVVEHIPWEQQLAFLNGVYGLLKPGGIFICRVPNANARLHGSHLFCDWTHHRAFTEHSLDFIVYNAGFKDIRIEEETRYKPKGQEWLHPKKLLFYALQSFFYYLRRLEMIATFGKKRGKTAPLTLNIIGIAKK